MPKPPTTVISQPIGALRPAERNARTHSKSQIGQIAASIRAFGFVNPVLVDGGNRIIAGHGRVAAAARLGMAQVPTLRVDHLTPAQIRAYMIADNRIAELAGWDKEILALEFGELVTIDGDLDLAVTGFAHAEIDLLIGAQDTAAVPDDEEADADPEAPVVTVAGDLWVLGEHKVLCGDVRDRQVIRRLMGETRARMVFTDPPYNVAIDGHVSGLGAHRHAEFACAAGEMSPDAFTTFLEVALGNLAACSRPGSLHYVCMDWRHLGELLAAGARVFTSQLNLCVWNKTNAGMGSFYRSKHELVAVFKQGRGSHVNNIALGRFGRTRSNVWEYAGANTWRAGRSADLADHPTVKPVMLVADAIQDASHRGDIVLDGFGGSGTTLLAAERTGRHARLVEIDPGYVDVTIRRWQNLTGRAAVCARTGVPFASRGASPAASTLVPEASKTRRRGS
jgi:DNA modification methylase